METEVQLTVFIFISTNKQTEDISSRFQDFVLFFYVLLIKTPKQSINGQGPYGS